MASNTNEQWVENWRSMDKYKDSIPGYPARFLFGFPDHIEHCSAQLKDFDSPSAHAELDKMIELSALFKGSIEKSEEEEAEQAPIVGNSSQDKEKLLARKGRLQDLIDKRKSAYVQMVTDQKAAEKKRDEAIARYDGWVDRVEARARDVRLHKAYIGRLASQVLELKREAQAFGQGGEARYAPSLITGEMTFHRLVQETIELQKMRAGVRAGNAKLAKLFDRRELADDQVEQSKKLQKINLQVNTGLLVQLRKDERVVSGWGGENEDGAEKKNVEEAEEAEEEEGGGGGQGER